MVAASLSRRPAGKVHLVLAVRECSAALPSGERVPSSEGGGLVVRPAHAVCRAALWVPAVCAHVPKRAQDGSLGGGAAGGAREQLKVVFSNTEQTIAFLAEHGATCQGLSRGGGATCLSVGSLVELAEGYESVGDARGGPLRPGDVGTVDRADGGTSVHVVSATGRGWHYNTRGLQEHGLSAKAGRPSAVPPKPTPHHRTAQWPGQPSRQWP